MRGGARLVLGPLLRHVGGHHMVVWVEADRPCEVDVLGRTAPTFAVAGHHYALVVVDGLEPGAHLPYQVRLDGRVVWPPPGSSLPASALRTLDPARPLRLVAGSCRRTAPHAPPWDRQRLWDPRALGPDALRVVARRMAASPPSAWPDALLLVGDQVYADVGGRKTGPAGFADHARFYRQAWTPPEERWLLSTVPSLMIFDDHDVVNAWHSSAAWMHDVRRRPWWPERLRAAVAAYWVYQHLGNLAPAELGVDPVLAAVRAADDGWDVVAPFAERAERDTPATGGHRWSYALDLGGTRVVVADSRNGRVLGRGRRAMLDDVEWAWVADRVRQAPGHVVLVSSVPCLLPGGLHDLEACDEALTEGAWGRWATRLGEALRRQVDLEHWAAFTRSFAALADLLREVATRPSPPPSLTLLSGDVHFSYLARVDLPSAVHQVVTSPLRNRVAPHLRAALHAAMSRPGAAVGQVARRAVGLGPTPLAWRVTRGPWFVNATTELTFAGPAATVAFDRAVDGSRLRRLAHVELTSPPA